jgi:hypothetical protein
MAPGDAAAYRRTMPYSLKFRSKKRKSIMQVLSFERCLDRRNRLRCALELTGRPYNLSEVASLGELHALSGLGNFSLAMVSSADLNDALAAIVFVRGRMPAGQIIACRDFASYDAATPRRMRDAGADIVFDSRSSPSILARVIEHFVWKRLQPDEGGSVLPQWAIREAMRNVAPSAVAL